MISEDMMGLNIKKFNEKLKSANHMAAKTLSMSLLEAQGLQSEIFELMRQYMSLSMRKVSESGSINSDMDGGKF